MKKGFNRNRARIMALTASAIILFLFALMGCSDKTDREMKADSGKSRDEMLSEIENTLQGYNEEPETEIDESVPELLVVLNNMGYEPRSDKELVLIVSGDDIVEEEVSFSVFDKKSSETPVFSGVLDRINSASYLSESGRESAMCYSGDFSGLFREGEYYITCCFGNHSCESKSFKIEKDHNRTLIAMRSLLVSKDEGPLEQDKEVSYDDEHESEITEVEGALREEKLRPENFMQIADLLLAYEFFDKELIEGGASQGIVPASLETARLLTEKLIEPVDDGDGSEEEAELGVVDNYRFAAILAKLSGDYAGADWEASKGWKKSAVTAFKTAEKLYLADVSAKNEELKTLEGAGQKSEEQATVLREELNITRSARFWAAAELYKLTGEKGYRKIAEEEAFQEIPSGFSGMVTGDLGSIAYLTSDKKTDRSLNDRLIESILKRAVEVSERPAEERFFAGDIEETGAYVQEELETARLCMFANLASQSTLFVERTEKAVDYLYGLNMEGRAFAEEDKNMPVLFILNGLANSYIAE